MSQDIFFSSISEHYNNQLPFVVYCKPNSFQVNALLQKNDTLFKVSDHSSSGFVFAPFDIRKDAVIIPYGISKSLKLDTEFIQAQDHEQKQLELFNDKESHVKNVDNAIDIIKNGDLEKVVLSRIDTLNLEGVELIEILKRVLLFYDSAFAYCWYHPQVGLWFGATPETLLKIEEGKLHTVALAGSQEYNGVTDVVWNDKEKNEQQIVTEYIVEQLKEVTSNLAIGALETIRAGHMLHLRTLISGDLNLNENSIKQVINKLHPTPAVCGVPKMKAIQFIMDNEDYNREFYTGYLGELNYEGKNDEQRTSDLYVNLRCMQIKDKKALLYVGGGITKDSNTEKEWQETVNKAKTMQRVIAF